MRSSNSHKNNLITAIVKVLLLARLFAQIRISCVWAEERPGEDHEIGIGADFITEDPGSADVEPAPAAEDVKTTREESPASAEEPAPPLQGAGGCAGRTV